MANILPITKAREELTSLVESAKNKLSHFVITVNGSPAAVLISAVEYESWKETNEILADSQLVKAIKQGEKDVQKGKVYDWEDVKKELKLPTSHDVSNKAYRSSKKRT
ncbi:hypothetical protein A3A93_05990 [Candidatus Roizmanbacteria bacterium RIFCSPLOWO2_01_FULL_38_12]|uniref:Antitoxin n=1 Tax=Candidatus Roizmanbacteria bacterium RIFCSPLOWO2_01_FULL_38_12 TaxID=1802061 RepID=A0A1F7IVC2_9BACT|nr:MAG: hypothetical protein A2861_02990 [Candidatus Roizmanbacteria bacterium RIFCSPHIGHO2_01_FULL_38_15]OGK36269.1 MAG: hypothetical protein A3F59_00130 [Candidatus Roizmanbacteria bacterium RIFCSPHIGHO2_12_FULL_38_13]OGK47308.1 MAG: hypothetical protein A3A93_05990 [Candidatus Roizmanbacteria bacterium RIFCSPLOWO2_01_FULL_38_12]